MKNSYIQFFDEYLATGGLDAKEHAEWTLIQRYRDKCSQRLRDRLPELYTKGKHAMLKQMEEWMKRPSIFEGMSKRDRDIWQSSELHEMPMFVTDGAMSDEEEK